MHSNRLHDKIIQYKFPEISEIKDFIVDSVNSNGLSYSTGMIRVVAHCLRYRDDFCNNADPSYNKSLSFHDRPNKVLINKAQRVFSAQADSILLYVITRHLR